MSKSARSIDDVIRELEFIVQDCRDREDPSGYFAALYYRVTVRVKQGIEAGYFEDGPRMERLDVIFAQRYLEAYNAYQRQEKLRDSWKIAFTTADRYWPIVLQHLLLGINAHINLDLGIAAAQISRGTEINALKGDFDKINELLSAMVNEVEAELAAIWPTMGKLIKWLDGTENLIMDFSMQLARDGAWKFAGELSLLPIKLVPSKIAARDLKIQQLGQTIAVRKWYIRLLLNIIRLGERGSVRDKIDRLSASPR
ncbi:MAG: DUF5995 family protein [Bacteroidota bacterium]